MSLVSGNRLTLTSMRAFGYGAREITSDRRSGNFPFKSINGKSLYLTVSQVSLPNTSLGKAQQAEGTWAIMQWFQLQYIVFLTTDSDVSSNTALCACSLHSDERTNVTWPVKHHSSRDAARNPLSPASKASYIASTLKRLSQMTPIEHQHSACCAVIVLLDSKSILKDFFK